ncbi:cellulase family glycosylhydrolase [Cystobacter ferrugineus]|uniref:Glycoside hydrolase family 5 domain-containing protein n=1 Tax=Cystobacter ferrugineus TaxID=83449 RepID=A0A1L9AZ46_9BACT|nr:cellulase family glycosylhydrolase [Cystobacter ferrugineus]OJH35246.1 hypothetical protein BON30_40050 [Cystobacter ferrugineus]
MNSCCPRASPAATGDEVLGTGEATLANPTGRFYIAGKDSVAPSGNKFYPVGANLDGWDFFQRDTEKQVDAAVKWGWNTIRINGALLAHPEFNTKGLVSGELSKPNFDKIDRIVQAYTAKEIVVMIEFHDTVWSGNNIDTNRQLRGQRLRLREVAAPGLRPTTPARARPASTRRSRAGAGPPRR